MKKTFLVLTCFVLTFNILSGQQVFNDSLKFTSKINISGSENSGVFSRINLRAGNTITLKKSRFEFSNNLTYRYNKTNNVQLANNWMNISMLQYHTKTKWQWFPIILYQFETNYLFQVKNRNRIGFGAGAFPINTNGNVVRFTTGYFYENELYNFGTFANSDLTAPRRKNNSAWFNLKSKIPLFNKKANFDLDFWYFQSFKENSDYALSVLPTLNVKVNKQISFHIKYEWRFENVYLNFDPYTDTNSLLVYGFAINFNN